MFGAPLASAALALAALAYLAAYGARTPLLALRGLTRVRNAALVVLPAIAMGCVALVLVGRVDRDLGAGALVLAIAPAPLVAPELVGRTSGRSDLAGALVVGTVVASLLAELARGALASGPLIAGAETFVLAAMVAGAVPALRDIALTPLRWVGWIAAAAVLAAGALGGPRIDAAVVLVALAMLAAGCATAAAVARVAGRDVMAAVGGAGLRDPVIAVAMASLGAPTGLPLVYGVFCLGVAALSLRPR